MKRPVQEIIVLAVSIMIVLLIVGCEEQNLSNPKKARLVADENIRLQKQLEQRDDEIEKQRELLEKCLQEKNALEKMAHENIQGMRDNAFKGLIEESKKLRQENEQLKARIAQLEEELKSLEEVPQLPDKPQPLQQP